MFGIGNGRGVPRPRGARTRRTLIAAGAMWHLTLAAAGAQAPAPGQEADGLVHATLTLEGRTIDVAFPPALRAGHHAYQWLLADTVGSRVRVGALDAHRALHLGTLRPDIEAIEAEIATLVAARQAEADAEPDAEEAEGAAEPEDADDANAEPADPDLWLVRNAAGWQLEIRPRGAGAVDVIPLSHRETAAAAPTFSASVHATGAESGQLRLRWGGHAWSADFRFEEIPQAPPRARVSGRGQSRTAADSNAAIARGNMLSERNETALVLPNGAGVTLVYWKSIDVEDEDYPNVAAAEAGDVIEMIRAPVLRLKSDVALQFGETDIPTGNLAPGFAGFYGVWLRRTIDGWRFVFNHEADSWGTQHDAAFDAAEIAADYTRTPGAFRPLGATIVPTGPDRGRLVVHWGPHEWAADFVIGD